MQDLLGGSSAIEVQRERVGKGLSECIQSRILGTNVGMRFAFISMENARKCEISFRNSLYLL